MATFKAHLKASTKEIFIRPTADAAPGGTTLLGSFDHGDDADDELGDDGVAVTENHVVFHHVRDLLYDAEILDPSIYAIKFLATSVNAGADFQLDLSAAETYTIEPTVLPANAQGTGFTFVSADPTKATVGAATGLVTPVAVGTSVITVTDTASGKTDTVTATVVA